MGGTNGVADKYRDSPQNGEAVRTGYPSIDKIMSPIWPGQLVAIGGRTSVGKTSLALGISLNVAKAGRQVVFTSTDKSSSEIRYRLLSMETGIPLERLSDPRLRNSLFKSREWDLVTDVGDQLRYLPFCIDDNFPQTMDGVSRKARDWTQKKGGLGLLVVDGLQTMASYALGQSNREQQMDEIIEGIVNDLKTLAMTLSCGVLVCSQISGGPGRRTGPRPSLSDLGESWSIAECSDVVMLLHRPDTYSDIEEWERQHIGQQYPVGLTEVNIAKQRLGPSQVTSALYFAAQCARFDDYHRIDDS